MILALLAALFLFVFIVSTFVLIVNSGSPAEARLSRLGTSSRPMRGDAPFSERVMLPVLDGLAHFFIQLLPHSFVARATRQLVAAGQPMTPQAFFVLVLITSFFFPAGLLALLASAGASISFVMIVFTIIIAFMGFLAPFVWVRLKAGSRRSAIWKRLPDAFDLITVSVEAGLGLDAALRQVAEKLRGPLAEELGQTLREVGMGRPRREALEEMAERTDVRELQAFVNAVIQAEQLGTSLGRVLRAQAMTLRVRRRQRAQEVARRAPVKLVFPLVIFIMPTFFIITLGPVFVHLVGYLHSR